MLLRVRRVPGPGTPAGRGPLAETGDSTLPGPEGDPAGRKHSKGSVISEQFLLHRVSTGEQAAVRECIARFGGLVWSLARRSGLPEAELDDAVHEIFTELWQNGHKYDPGIASEAAFVAVITRRRLIDRRRKIGRRPVSTELLEDATPGADVGSPTGKIEISEEASAAARALETLTPGQQRVLRLSVYQGLSHELISRATGLPLGTVKTHARRGLIRLRELLSGAPAADADGSKREGA